MCIFSNLAHNASWWMMQYVFIIVIMMTEFDRAFSIKTMTPFIRSTIDGALSVVSPQSYSYFRPMSSITNSTTRWTSAVVVFPFTATKETNSSVMWNSLLMPFTNIARSVIFYASLLLSFQTDFSFLGRRWLLFAEDCRTL